MSRDLCSQFDRAVTLHFGSSGGQNVDCKVYSENVDMSRIAVLGFC